MNQKPEKFTYQDFLKLYHNEEVCLKTIFQIRFKFSEFCSNCKKPFKYYNVKGTKYYECAWCAHKVSPLAGTIFHKSSTNLQTWFLAIFLFTHSKNGVAAKELQRLTGVTYKTAWRICKQIRLLFKDIDSLPLKGIVEIDETYIGGKESNKHKDKKTPNTQGRSLKTKSAILGVVERKGNIIAKVVADTKSSTIQPFIREHVIIKSEIKTDEYRSYKGLHKMGYSHDTVDHSKGQYVKEGTHTNNVEGFWSQLKRSIHETYHQVSLKYLQSYVNEFSYRYNHRKDVQPLFFQVLNQVVLLV